MGNWMNRMNYMRHWMANWMTGRRMGHRNRCRGRDGNSRRCRRAVRRRRRWRHHRRDFFFRVVEFVNIRIESLQRTFAHSTTGTRAPPTDASGAASSRWSLAGLPRPCRWFGTLGHRLGFDEWQRWMMQIRSRRPAMVIQIGCPGRFRRQVNVRCPGQLSIFTRTGFIIRLAPRFVDAQFGRRWWRSWGRLDGRWFTSSRQSGSTLHFSHVA